MIFRYKLHPYERAILRLWYSGITSAFQAEEAGSIPVGRSQKSSCIYAGTFFIMYHPLSSLRFYN